MRIQRIFFLIFLGLCALVLVMILQTLYLQQEGADDTANGGHVSRLARFAAGLKYYIFLPRTKIQLLVKDLRRRYKSSRSDVAADVDSDRAHHISDMFADMIGKTEYVKYLVFVISAPNKRDLRDLIRQYGYRNYNWTDTEGNPLDWKHYFVVGQNEDESVNQAVREEAKTNPDLLVGDFADSYKNLVFKTLWLIEWASNRYDFDAMIKCDDDTIINLSKFDALMQTQDLTQPFYGGVRFGGMPVFRTGRYQVTKEEWEPDRYPPYCSGGGYVLNKPAILKLLQVHFSHVQPVFLVEDAFMGTLAFHADLEVVSLVPNFRAFSPHEFCDKDTSTLLHYVKNDYQKVYMDYYRGHGRWCDEQWVKDHKKPKKPKK